MKNMITKMVGAAMLLGAAVPAMAQTAPTSGVSARLGIFWPTDSTTRRSTDEAWFGAGFDYRLREMSSMMDGRTAALTLSLDFAAKDDFRSLPLLLNYQVRQNELYFFGGVGVNFARYASGVNTKSDTTFAYQVGAGYDFQQGATPLFVEVKFLGNEKSELNAFGTYVGVRF